MRLWKHDFRGRTLLLAVTMASCQAFLLLGYDQGMYLSPPSILSTLSSAKTDTLTGKKKGVMSGIIGAQNRFGRDFNNPDSAMQGNITALYDIGCVFGSIISYFIGERLGRRTMLILGGGIMVIGVAVLTSSYTVAQLIAGRIITGVGNGMNSSTAPVYQSECSPASIRGALLTLQGTVTILGVVIAYWYVYPCTSPGVRGGGGGIDMRTGWITGPVSPNRLSNGDFPSRSKLYSPSCSCSK